MLNLNCVICAELFAASDDVHVTICGHMFHFTCLKQWLERSKSCPQCRNKCSDRNIFRVYFNLANLDASRIDVGSLQEQLDNADLQLKMKEKELTKAQNEIKNAKETQKKCMKTISGLEKEVKSNSFIVLNYQEKVKTLQHQLKAMENVREEAKQLKSQIESMNGINTLLTTSMADAEKLLKNEHDPKILSVWVATLKRELKVCETKKNDMRSLLKAAQNDLRKELESKRAQEERMSLLESENYILQEKIKALEANSTKNMDSTTSNSSKSGLNTTKMSPIKDLIKQENRQTISPTIKNNIKQIEESSSPYLNIKSSSIGMAPLFKRNHDHMSNGEMDQKITTTKYTILKISPGKNPGAIRKDRIHPGNKMSILKKPRLGMLPGTVSAGNFSLMKPLGPNYVYNGFGGSERVDPFAKDLDDEEKATVSSNYTTNTKTISINNRLKSGGLRNIKLNK